MPASRLTLFLLRWSARLASALLVTLVVLIAIAHRGLPNVLEQPVPVQIEFAALGLMVLGLILGWIREAAGGAITLLGLGTFVATEVFTNHRMPGGAIPWFLIPAILFLAVSAMQMGRRGDHGSTLQ
jgi:hypothetical protein